jgi:hypothetical protein
MELDWVELMDFPDSSKLWSEFDDRVLSLAAE